MDEETKEAAQAMFNDGFTISEIIEELGLELEDAWEFLLSL